MAWLPPSLILAALVSSAYAALFNLWRNGSPRDLLYCLVAAWTGFAIGQAGGRLLGLNWAMLGSVYLLEGTLFSWSLLLLMNWLRMPSKS